MLSLLDFVGSCRKRGTRDQYRQSLCLFFECLTGSTYEGRRRPADHVAHLETASLDYLSSSQDYIRDLIKFSTFLADYAPTVQHSHMTTVLLWLELNDIAIPRAKLKFVKNRLPKKRVSTRDHALTHDEIRRWYEHLSRVGRITLQIQLSTGMRIGEALALMPDDIDWSTEPVTVHIRGTRTVDGIGEPKNGEPRISYLSSEAAFALKEWLAYRPEYFAGTCKKLGQGRTLKDSTDPRLIPVVHNTIQTAYTNALKKAGLFQVDKKTNWSTITSHSLRKFANSQLKAAGMPAEMVEMILGHEGYLSGAYRRYPEEQVRKAYLAVEYAISLNAPSNMPAIRADLEQSKETQQALAGELIRLRNDLEALARNDRDVMRAYMNLS